MTDHDTRHGDEGERRPGGGHRITRKDFLRLAGLTGGLVASGAAGNLIAGVAGSPAAYAAGSRASAGSVAIVSGDRFPIGLFWPPPPFQTTLERYREIVSAGFTFTHSNNYLFADSLIQRYALGIADQVGLQLLIDDPTVRWLVGDFSIGSGGGDFTLTPRQATIKFQRVLDTYAGHPSFAGFDLYDEPYENKVETLANAVAIVRSLAPSALPYINLLPDFGGGPSYAKFAAAVKPLELSFDRYPILASGEDTGYFQNWADVRAAAMQANIPAWVYIQSVGFNGHAVPTAADLLWQINISLAYGCKGIQYFTYWTPDPARGEGFTSALLTVDGHRTPLYDAAKEINNHYLAPLGKVLLPLVSESVQAANLAAPPQGLPAFTPDAYVAGTAGSPAVLGRFTAGGADPTRWLLVANFSRHNPASVTLTFGPAVRRVDRFDPAESRYGEGGDNTGSLNLAPGAARLLRLRG